MIVSAALALAADDLPGPVEPSFPSDEAARTVNSGFGFGLAGLTATDAASAQRLGLHLELRREEALGRRFQFNLGAGAGLTTPENTVATVEWGTEAGRTITSAFGDVSEWVRRGRGTASEPFRSMGAFFAYTGLGISYVAVPVVWAASPFAAIGHSTVGATLSVHSAPTGPNAFVELGFGGALYGDPLGGGPGVGCGPLVGVGTQFGKESVGLRLLVSPPGLHTEGGSVSDTLLLGSLALGL
jgi:hypothetical protein